jgi:hypothetical protein
MTATEIREMFTNVTISGTSITTGSQFTSYYAPDGSVTLVAGGGFRDTGKYRIEDDGRMCTQMQAFRAGQNICVRLYKDGPKIFRSEVGGGIVEMKNDFRPGNPDKL